MAVFTPLSIIEIASYLKEYTLGDLIHFEEIKAGIENSNFFLTTTKGRFVLTVFEKLDFKELPYYLELMKHLAKQDILVPSPIIRNDKHLLGKLKNKPSTIVTRLEGKICFSPLPIHCEQVGQMLARLHLAGRQFTLHQPNLRSLDWWQKTAPLVIPYLTEKQKKLLIEELSFQTLFFQSNDYKALPSGPCHCDLFKDNVLFKESNKVDIKPALGGFFDFYFAGNDKWLFDLAVCANDWCIDTITGTLNNENIKAFLTAYQTIRPFTAIEKTHWKTMLRAGALRFWISRLYDFYLPRAAKMLKTHDPNHFEKILRARINLCFSSFF